MESELKMLFNAEELPKLKSLAVLEKLAVEPPTSQQLINIYFDTPELDLHRTGIELRIRRLGEKRLQTLKAGGSMAGGTVHREEHGSITLTYGYIESMGQREYFSLINDATLPGP